MTKIQERQSGTSIVLAIAPNTAFDTTYRQTNNSPGGIEER